MQDEVDRAGASLSAAYGDARSKVAKVNDVERELRNEQKRAEEVSRERCPDVWLLWQSSFSFCIVLGALPPPGGLGGYLHSTFYAIRLAAARLA